MYWLIPVNIKYSSFVILICFYLQLVVSNFVKKKKQSIYYIFTFNVFIVLTNTNYVKFTLSIPNLSFLKVHLSLCIYISP